MDTGAYLKREADSLQRRVYTWLAHPTWDSLAALRRDALRLEGAAHMARALNDHRDLPEHVNAAAAIEAIANAQAMRDDYKASVPIAVIADTDYS